MTPDPDLVSVIIPAFNAAATIEETLLSVRRQTHQALEIIIVDDGSADRTLAVAEAQATLDPRVRVLSQANAGVAAARNRGIAEARGDVVAPIDADDLWRPRKVERQLRALRAGGPEIGLAYCQSAVIDEDSIITANNNGPIHGGDVLPHLFYGNFVGNGSSPLMRKRLVEEVGGYDASLRARKAQGCEDWKLYLLLAERSHFAVVSDHLVGYRYTRAAMSGDVAQMLRSDAIVRDEMAARHPNYRFELDEGRRHYIDWLLWRELGNLNWHNCVTLTHERSTSSSALRTAARRAKIGAKYVRQKLRGRSPNTINFPFLVSADVAKPSLSARSGAVFSPVDSPRAADLAQADRKPL